MNRFAINLVGDKAKMIDEILEFNEAFVKNHAYEKYITNKYPLYLVWIPG
jgi:hypothetical protein